MYERLMFCEFAIADLSFANANVFYELGIRHALKPYTTVSIFEKGTTLPFDAAALRTFPYEYKDGAISDVVGKIAALAERVKMNIAAQRMQEDSPIAQLITKYKFPDLTYLLSEADTFVSQVNDTNKIRMEMNDLVDQWKKLNSDKEAAQGENRNSIIGAQNEIIDKVKSIEKSHEAYLSYNYELLDVLLNTYKSVNAFPEVVDMLAPLVYTTMDGNILLKQQLALAYNKIGKRDASREVLEKIIEQYGPDPETNGLLGAVYKGLMGDNSGDEFIADGYRQKAIETYLNGFAADPREFYPGVNALTLMILGDEKDERFLKFFPLVWYAVERQLVMKAKDYWVQATAMELAILDRDSKNAKKYLLSALMTKPAEWMKSTTADNLEKIYNKFTLAGNTGEFEWIKEIIGRLRTMVIK